MSSGWVIVALPFAKTRTDSLAAAVAAAAGAPASAAGSPTATIAPAVIQRRCARSVISYPVLSVHPTSNHTTLIGRWLIRGKEVGYLEGRRRSAMGAALVDGVDTGIGGEFRLGLKPGRMRDHLLHGSRWRRQVGDSRDRRRCRRAGRRCHRRRGDASPPPSTSTPRLGARASWGRRRMGAGSAPRNGNALQVHIDGAAALPAI